MPKNAAIKITITSTSGRAPTSQHGTIITVAGKRYYVLKSCDSSASAAAEAAYDDEHLYYAIVKANPNVNFETLQPGDKLLIPARPSRRTRP